MLLANWAKEPPSDDTSTNRIGGDTTTMEAQKKEWKLLANLIGQMEAESYTTEEEPNGAIWSP